jgi:hypothetical protein
VPWTPVRSKPRTKGCSAEASMPIEGVLALLRAGRCTILTITTLYQLAEARNSDGSRRATWRLPASMQCAPPRRDRRGS